MARPAASSYGEPMNSSRSDGAPRAVTVLGATGSVGTSTVDLLRRDRAGYRVEALSANRRAAPLAQLARDLGARFAAVADPAAYGDLKDGLGPSGIEAAAGEEAVIEAARRPADWVMAAVSGATGLRATMAAVERGAMVALCNKECLVCAGTLFMRRAAETGATILPADSEHNAVFQAFGAGRREDVRRVILTASGGPFRTWSIEAIRSATVEQALRHPNWSMGPKITIDSATLMNKGLEIIEANHLFALAPHEIDVLVHPQSIVHAMVEFRDGSLIAQLGPPDMRIPISHCLGWPARIESPATRLDLERIATLSFELPDIARFPALGLARRAMEAGNGATTVLNAANEVAVAEFIAGRLSFGGIAALVATAMEAASARGIMRAPASVEDAVRVDHSTRLLTLGLLPEIAAKAS